jgi:hypothetical protein
MKFHTRRGRLGKRALLLLGGVATVLVLGSVAAADPTAVPAPSVPGTPPVPGAITDPGKASDTMTTLKVTPDVAVAGKSFTVTGAGLPASKPVTIVWMTANVRYILDPKPDSVDYIGRKVDKIGVVLATGQTTASGAYSTTLKVPKDFGGLHDIFAVVDGVQVAKGGFLLERTVTISPQKGPIGTPITVSVVGMGSPTYESVGAVLYDNRYAGAVSANTTRGVTSFKIRASGKPGVHWIEYAGSSHTVPYLNMEQSPVPWTDSRRVKFTVTKDAGPPKAYVEQAVSVQPTISARTTVIDADVAKDSTAKVTIDSNKGTILSKTNLSATGLTPNAPVQILWTSVVGNRVNCTGQCWKFTSQPIGQATAAADGSLKTPVTVPDGLGGWHGIQLVQAGKLMAQVPYFVKRSFVKAPKVVKAGQPFYVELKGVGWTQLDNTLAITYDNSYIGYACGFNSNGYVRAQLFATGEPGTHIIDFYPLLYTQQPAYPYSQLGMVPLLGFARDAPGLAAGYDIPAIRIAIKVVK